MKALMAVLLVLGAGVQTNPTGGGKVPAALNFTVNNIDGKPVKDIQDFLATYKAKKVGQEMLCQVTRDRNPLTIRLVRSSFDEGTKR